MLSAKITSDGMIAFRSDGDPMSDTFSDEADAEAAIARLERGRMRVTRLATPESETWGGPAHFAPRRVRVVAVAYRD